MACSRTARSPRSDCLMMMTMMMTLMRDVSEESVTGAVEPLYKIQCDQALSDRGGSNPYHSLNRHWNHKRVVRGQADLGKKKQCRKVGAVQVSRARLQLVVVVGWVVAWHVVHIMCLGIHARQPLAFQVSQTTEAARRSVIHGALFTMNLASALDVAKIFCCFVILNIPPVQHAALPSKRCHARRTTTSNEHVMRKNTCTQAGDVDGGILPPTMTYSKFVFFCLNVCSSFLLILIVFPSLVLCFLFLIFSLFVLPLQTCALHKFSPGTPPSRPLPQQRSTSHSSNDEPVHDNHQKIPAADTRQPSRKNTRAPTGPEDRLLTDHEREKQEKYRHRTRQPIIPSGNQHWPLQYGASKPREVRRGGWGARSRRFAAAQPRPGDAGPSCCQPIASTRRHEPQSSAPSHRERPSPTGAEEHGRSPSTWLNPVVGAGLSQSVPCVPRSNPLVRMRTVATASASPSHSPRGGGLAVVVCLRSVVSVNGPWQWQRPSSWEVVALVVSRCCAHAVLRTGPWELWWYPKRSCPCRPRHPCAWSSSCRCCCPRCHDVLVILGPRCPRGPLCRRCASSSMSCVSLIPLVSLQSKIRWCPWERCCHTLLWSPFTRAATIWDDVSALPATVKSSRWHSSETQDTQVLEVPNNVRFKSEETSADHRHQTKTRKKQIPHVPCWGHQPIDLTSFNHVADVVLRRLIMPWCWWCVLLSCPVLSCYVMSYLVTWHVMLCHVMSCYVISCSKISGHLISSLVCHIMSRCDMLCHIKLCSSQKWSAISSHVMISCVNGKLCHGLWCCVMLMLWLFQNMSCFCHDARCYVMLCVVCSAIVCYHILSQVSSCHMTYHIMFDVMSCHVML